MAFIETPRFPDNIAFGAVGGAGFNTDVVVLGSGFEQRNINWLSARGKWDVSHGIKLKTEMSTIIAFHRAMKGRAHGFRFKDWSDYQVKLTDGTLIPIAGFASQYQITKNYSAGSLNDARAIRKPIAGTIIAYRSGVAMTAGSGAGQIAIDATTGIVTIVPDSTKSINANSTKTITAISKANPGVVTATAHGFVTGDKIKIIGVLGMTQVNNLYFTITVIDANNFSIGVDSTAYSTYASSGSAIKYGVTQTSPIRIYSSAHGLSNGTSIGISGVAGMVELNGNTYTVSNSSSNYFDLLATTGTPYGAYSGGGTLAVYPQVGDALTVSCEFDVPVRFDDDRLPVAYIYKDVLQVDQIPIIEIRI